MFIPFQFIQPSNLKQFLVHNVKISTPAFTQKDSSLYSQPAASKDNQLNISNLHHWIYYATHICTIFQQEHFQWIFNFLSFDIGNLDSCQGDADYENLFSIVTAQQPTTYNYQCVRRNTLPALLEFQLKPEDYETRISLSTTEPVSPASVSLALKYKGQFYHFDKSLLTDI